MVRLLTYAAAIEHEVPRAAVAQAPTDGCGAENGDDAVHVYQQGRAVHEDGVVRCGCPEPAVRLGLRRLPEG